MSRLTCCVCVSVLVVVVAPFTQALAAARCIIFQDKARGPVAAINIESRTDSKHLPLLNAAQVDKSLWYAVVDADAETKENGVLLTNVVRVADPPAGEWLLAIEMALLSGADEVVRREAPAFIEKHAASGGRRAAEYWAQTYEQQCRWDDALAVYEKFTKDHPAEGAKLAKHVNRLKTHCIGKPNWGRFYCQRPELYREVGALSPEQRDGAEGKALRTLLQTALAESKDIPGADREREELGKLLLLCQSGRLEEHLAQLKKLMLEERGDNASHAVQELGKLAAGGNQKALELVKEGLSAQEPRVRKGCAEIAGDIRLAGVSERLIGLLSDADDDVRNAAAHALGRIGAREARAKLLELKTKDKSPGVRRAAENALTRIDKAE